MLTTAPHLYIRRPSPTTAEFTVTTCPPLTLPLRLALACVHAARLSLLLAIILLLYGRWTASPSFLGAEHIRALGSPVSLLLAGDFPSLVLSVLQLLHASAAGQVCARAATHLLPSWWGLAVLAGALLYATRALGRIHTTESLLVLRGLGIQTASSYSSYNANATGSSSGSSGGSCVVGGGGGRWWGRIFGGGGAGGNAKETRFIPTEKIQDVLINEAFRGFEVRYYLVVVVEGEEELVVVFPRLLPRRRIVEAVWRGVRGCLYEPDSSGVAAAGGGMGIGIGGGDVKSVDEKR